jgi:Xaa-Pro aminopeptidase
MTAELVRAKHEQAARLMDELDLDVWLIQFARETGLREDPTAYLVGMSVTWPSAFLLRRDGRSAAVIATGDQAVCEALGVWDEIHPYVAGPSAALLALLDDWAPRSLGVTWDRSDHLADGITHGMLLQLQALLEGTPHADRLVSAGPLASALRSRKLPLEIEGIARAVRATEEILERIERELLRPGAVAAEVQREVQRWILDQGWGFAWEMDGNPMVDFGPPAGPLGHAPPGATPLAPGHLAHVDIGLVVDGFASDLQRLWYLPAPGETEAPAEVVHAFETVTGAIEAAVEALAPGVQGHEVDAPARALIASRGYEEPQFAMGHHVGRVAHDAGGVLGPLWERYGDLPRFQVVDGNVFAVETGLLVPGRGIVAVEEEVVVGPTGSRYMSRPQRAIKLLPAP